MRRDACAAVVGCIPYSLELCCSVLFLSFLILLGVCVCVCVWGGCVEACKVGWSVVAWGIEKERYLVVSARVCWWV